MSSRRGWKRGVELGFVGFVVVGMVYLHYRQIRLAGTLDHPIVRRRTLYILIYIDGFLALLLVFGYAYPGAGQRSRGAPEEPRRTE